MSDYVVILFYKFVSVEDPQALKQSQMELCKRLKLNGRILIAQEGINGTLEGTMEAVLKYQETLREDERFKDIVFKESQGTGSAFRNLKIKVRPEVVTLGAGSFDIPNETAREMTAEEFHALYENQEDFVVLDLRNDYELEVGYFDKTVNPRLRNFRDLPDKIKELEGLKDKKVITVCTGGIRCEKATCFLKKEGFQDIYQLKDGIHTYIQKFPGAHFKGTLFVFDNRMATPVIEGKTREVVGRCRYCSYPSEELYSDDSMRPSLKVICCDRCLEGPGAHLRDSRIHAEVGGS